MRPFEREKDLIEVNEWLLKRELKPLQLEELPNYGMIEDGIACGFVVLTDTQVCFLEAFITNPGAGLMQRDRAITRLVKWGTNFGSACGYRHCWFITTQQSLLDRGLKLGFVQKDMLVGAAAL